ncbi:chemotaxis response regulator protein-glutamate methylesterase of group 2 operon [Aliidongia dinghuensis]|uniref:Protein-glutamate methylesterase/protein-glutamine glutaminase n=1 Tax=Aliidongia dinghuensis TaxID=1867774 RepID=A0A8J2YX95_9PROT|nr:chemotaxis response regulator protein-glutamate methylesterase [Aliidongia dinghuensis]GGF35328.1 chemotaxis response regulator protein-glutamate methylesterase of group 2 operon [Aliidongia dinghuensis]
MVCDDSAVIRGLISRSLEADPEIHVVTTVSNGQMALSALARHSIEVCILDIEMPVMDGLTALPKMIEAQPNLQVVMASTLTRRNAEISMKALAAGAADYLAKPTTSMALNAAADFKAELAAKVKALGAVRRRAAGIAVPHPQGPTAAPAHAPAHSAAAQAPAPIHRPIGAPAAPSPIQTGTPHAGSTHVVSPAARPTGAPGLAPLRPTALAAGRGPLSLRPAPTEVPEIIAIGSSTGGPQALFAVLAALKPGLQQPIVITQHMPATFTTILAEHIERASGIPTHEAAEGMALQGGHIYVAPGEFHMTIEAHGAQKIVKLLKTPPENYCRPSVDPMLRSLIKLYARRIFTVILTGMGQDGLKGSEAVVAAGGAVIAQDEATSVVWGMPGAVATAGLCSAVLPLAEIASYVRKVATRAGA